MKKVRIEAFTLCKVIESLTLFQKHTEKGHFLSEIDGISAKSCKIPALIEQLRSDMAEQLSANDCERLAVSMRLHKANRPSRE